MFATNMHRCQGTKSGTERTKKRKNRELVIFPPPGGVTGTVVQLVHRLDATRILPELRATWDIFYPGVTN